MVISLLLLLNFVYAEEITQEELLKSRDSYTDIVHLNGRNFVYMAQNSPEWDKLICSEKEEDKCRYFGDSGCVITAASLAIINTVPIERLSDISSLHKRPLLIDTRSITNDFGHKNDVRFLVEKDEDYFRYFPLVIGNWCTGNNNNGMKGRRSHGFLRTLLNLYQLEYFTTYDIGECVAALNDGAIIFTSSGGERSPIAPKFGHYFLLISADDKYIYIMDPYYRDVEAGSPYPADKKNLIEHVSGGIARFKIKDVDYLRLNLKFVILPNENTPAYTAEGLKKIIEKSNGYVTYGDIDKAAVKQPSVND
ncbi:MAG TPA: hypothetical protein GXZ91_02690 [Christensenellaceae bacterium]|jgi:hypothetical protein|nr:hypothetical protein [Christensenellaceae bacterium]